MKPRSISRRKFVGTGLSAAAGISLIPTLGTSNQSLITQNSKIQSPKNILILGGTGFLGPHQVAYALEQGHNITTFTRGKTKPNVHTKIFDHVEMLIGDRENNLEALKGRKWDAVIDNSGRKVEWTQATAELLKESAEMYLYVSSVSVFYPYYKQNPDETDKLVLKMPSDAAPDEKGLYDYGIMKANSELAAKEHFGKERVAVIRPTFMMGPGDRTDRFMYYPTRLSKGGGIIIPGGMNDRVQFIDVRDIADWMIRLIENNTSGVYNGVGPEKRFTMPQYVYGSHSAFGTGVEYFHIDDYDFLRENNMTFQAPWVLEEGKFAGILGAVNKRAIEAGITYRPLAQSSLDTANWWYSNENSDERRKSFEANPQSLHNRQEELLNTWKKFKK